MLTNLIFSVSDTTDWPPLGEAAIFVRWRKQMAKIKTLNDMHGDRGQNYSISDAVADINTQYREGKIKGIAFTIMQENDDGKLETFLGRSDDDSMGMNFATIGGITELLNWASQN